MMANRPGRLWKKRQLSIVVSAPAIPSPGLSLGSWESEISAVPPMQAQVPPMPAIASMLGG